MREEEGKDCQQNYAVGGDGAGADDAGADGQRLPGKLLGLGRDEKGERREIDTGWPQKGRETRWSDLPETGGWARDAADNSAPIHKKSH